MKLTQSIINEAPSFISATESRTLSLRNHNLSSLDAIHTLELSDIHSTVDLSKNELSYITPFPKLLRLKTLILANNHIRNVKGLANLVNLECLSLTYNEILYLSDLEDLNALASLTSLYLVGNPVAKHKLYRLWCIWRFPRLQVLDFERITDAQRKKAAETFTNDPELVESVLSLGGSKSSSESSSKHTGTKGLTESDRQRLESELEVAESLEEIQRLEEILTRGHY